MDDMQPEEPVLPERITWLLAAAEAGSPVAQYIIGECYWAGQDVEQDSERAIQWFRRAAAQSHAVAQRYLGWAYANGLGVAADRDTARAWLEAAADLGSVPAMRDLYQLLEDDESAEARAAGRAALERAALAHDPGAQLLLGDLTYREQSNEEGQCAAAAWWFGAALQGNASAQHRLARAFSTGEGVPISHEATEYWLRRSADEGHHMPALSDLGALLLAKAETRQDVLDAKARLCRAASEGESSAFYILGAHALHVEDHEGAIPWLHEAARRGLGRAQQRLGECLLDGVGLPADPVQGCVWLHQAAANGVGLGEEGYTNTLSRLEAATAALTPAQQDAVQEKLRALREINE